MQKKNSVVQKLGPHKALKITPTSIIGVKNALQRKYSKKTRVFLPSQIIVK